MFESMTDDKHSFLTKTLQEKHGKEVIKSTVHGVCSDIRSSCDLLFITFNNQQKLQTHKKHCDPFHDGIVMLDTPKKVRKQSKSKNATSFSAPHFYFKSPADVLLEPKITCRFCIFKIQSSIQVILITWETKNHLRTHIHVCESVRKMRSAFK